jgi:hypothetical protein
VDASTDETVGESTADPSSLAFVVEGLGAGSYYLYAGTDLDGDGYIGDSGDLLGAWPDLDDPQTLELGFDASRGGLRVPLVWADDAGFARKRLGR